MKQRHHRVIALDTLSYDDEKGLCSSATESMSAEAIRRGEHLATAEIRDRFKATVKRFRNTFTSEFVEASLSEFENKVEIVSDIRSPLDLRGRNHRISFVVFAYLNAQDDAQDNDNEEGDDLVYFSSSTLKLLTQRAKSMNSASVFVVALIPGEHRTASLERFKQLQFEADGQLSRFPGIDALSSTILPVFVDAKQHMAVESRRRLAFALTHYADWFVEDSSAYQSVAALRKMVEIGVSDYSVGSRKRTIDDEPVLLSDWSTFLLANQEQVDEDKKANLLALVRDFVTGNDATVALPSADALDNDDDNNDSASTRGMDFEDDLFFNR